MSFGWLVATYVDDVKSLLDGALGVVGERGINLSRDTAGNNLQDLLAELDQQTVKGSLNLSLLGAALLLRVVDGNVDQLGILGLLGCGKDAMGAC